MNSHPEKVEFSPPEGFIVPENTDGGPFSLVCDFEMHDGMLCMTKLGDHDMPGYGKDDNDSSSSKPDYSDYSNAMQSQMKGTQS